MTLAFSDGVKYNSNLDYLLDRPIIEEKDDPNKTNSKGKASGGDAQGADYGYHVPLLASALMDHDGNKVGLVIDSRAKGHLSKKEEELIDLHESTELPFMNDAIKTGMSPSEAYAVGHKHAIERETIASRAHWGDEGHEKYKDKIRQLASIAAEPSDKERHLDAHTTRYGLDEAENVYPIQGTAEDTLLKYQDNRYNKFRKENKEPAKVLPIRTSMDTKGMRPSTNLEDNTNKNLPTQTPLEFDLNQATQQTIDDIRKKGVGKGTQLDKYLNDVQKGLDKYGNPR